MERSDLATLMQVRTAEAARATALRGTAGCRDLSAAMDAAVRLLTASSSSPGAALIAVGAYGREELFRHSGLDLLVLTDRPAPAPAFPESLRAAGIPVHLSTRTLVQLREDADDIETLFDYLDARLIDGDEETFRQFVAARRQLLRHARAPLRREMVRRHYVRNEIERWQLVEPNLLRSRGGLNALQTLRAAARLGDLIGDKPDAIAVAALAEDGELLVRARAALHALSEETADRWCLDQAPAVAAMLDEPPGDLTRRLLLAMRRIDAAAAAVFETTQESRLARWARRLLPPSPPAHDLARLSDRQRVAMTLESVEPRSLDAMPRDEWLERLLPEWDSLRGKPHAAPLHEHPVDTHIVRTIVEARRVIAFDDDGMGTPLVAQEFAANDEVLLAALLHDVGQATPDDVEVGPAIAVRILSRLGFDATSIQRIAKITALNQLLSVTALRRDISEPQVIEEVAGLMGDVSTLHLLYLVSIADARATGPGTWHPWKAALMRTLYVRVLAYLGEHAHESGETPLSRREAVLEELSGEFDREQVARHLDALTPSYLLAIRPATIGEHLSLIEQAAGGTAIRHDRLSGMERLTVVTPDRPGLLSLVAGALAANSVSVLGCSAYTRSDGVAIEVIHVKDALGGEISGRRWSGLQQDIERAVAGQLDIDAAVRAARVGRETLATPARDVIVRVSNADADPYSVVEVIASDRGGLLYAITNALHGQRINIFLAKVDTLGTQVVDAFHILRENGRRIEAPDEIQRLQERIVEAVATLDTE